MRVIGVDGNVIGQKLPLSAVLAAEYGKGGADAGRNKLKPLLETPQATVLAGVIGVQDGGYRFRIGSGGIGHSVLAAIERFEIEMLVDGLGAPNAKLVHSLSAKADNGDVIGNGQDVLCTLDGIEDAIALGMTDDMAAEADADRLIRAANLPRIAAGEPFIGDFDLTAVYNLLLEKTVTIAHTVTIAGDILMSHGIKEAGCKAAKTPVPKGSVGLHAAEVVQIATHLAKRFVNHVTNAKVD